MIAKTRAFAALPVSRLALLEGWAMVSRAAGYVWRPTSVDDLRATLALARDTGRTVAPRGSGYSYADAALNAEEIVLDLSAMRRVVAWESDTGVITVEPGLTVRDLWRETILDGWWPAVVPGTMAPTVGGCLAMNVHGKNAWKAGTLGEHVLSFDLMAPDGTIATVTPESDPHLFHAAIGGLGMLGLITSVTLQLERVVSGRLTASQRVARSLDEMFAIFAQESPNADYLVGWIDGFASGKALGRGLVDRADYIATPDSASLHPSRQDLPPTIAGIVPRSSLWRALKLVTNDPGMALVNAAQFARGSRQSPPHTVPHAQFHFFHDYVPTWKRSWLPGGLRQFQAFAPAAVAPSLFADLLARSHKAGVTPYLCVFKQHRGDPFLLSYQCDGYSLSLDYHVTAANAHNLSDLLIAHRDATIESGGRLYLAKDDTLDARSYARGMGDERIERFLSLKRTRDPGGLLSSNLFRRVFAPD